MPSLIDFRRRIRTVKNTQQLTKAMKMISAAKLRKTQERVVAARPYAGHLRQLLMGLASAARAEGEVALPLLEKRDERHIQLVLITSDRGLAGAFNSNVNRAAQRFIEEHGSRKVRVETIGRKGRDYLTKMGATLSGSHTGISQKVKYSDAQQVAQVLIDRYVAGDIDSIYLIYNEFRSMLAQTVSLVRVLPIEVPEEQAEGGVDYILEQKPEQMLESLLPRFVEVSLYQALLESEASEHAARMTAMDAATNNAADVIEKLTLHMNRVRQASITKEIIEVVSGAAAIS